MFCLSFIAFFITLFVIMKQKWNDIFIIISVIIDLKIQSDKTVLPFVTMSLFSFRFKASFYDLLMIGTDHEKSSTLNPIGKRAALVLLFKFGS